MVLLFFCITYVLIINDNTAIDSTFSSIRSFTLISDDGQLGVRPSQRGGVDATVADNGRPRLLVCF